MATDFDNFGSYSNGDIETVSSAKWTKQRSSTGWTYLVATDAGATGGKILDIRDDNQNTGDVYSIIVNDDIGEQTGDVEVYARYWITDVSNQSLGQPCGPVLAASDNQSYGVRVVDSTNVQAARFGANGAVASTPGTAFAVTEITDGGYVKARLARSGDTIRLKFWSDGESEPEDWQDSGDDTTLSGVKPGVSFRDFNAGPFTVDVVGIGTGVDSAPTSDGGGGGTVNTKMLESSVAVSDESPLFMLRNRLLSSMVDVTEPENIKTVITNFVATSEIQVSDEAFRWAFHHLLLQSDIAVTDSFISSVQGQNVFTKVLTSELLLNDEALPTFYRNRLLQSDLSVLDAALLWYYRARVLGSDVTVSDGSMSALQRFILLSDAISVDDALDKQVVADQVFSPLVVIGVDQPKIALGSDPPHMVLGGSAL